MSRLHLTFACGSLTLAGTLDTAPATTGLLIVSGGNEVRSGAFGGQAALANRVASAGFPVFRFDRRGVGDSEGENRGYQSSANDIEAARQAFLAIAPDVERVVAFGNCDAASALMLNKGSGFDGLVLSNPWTFEDNEPATEAASPPPSAIRQRYLSKLKDPKEIARLLRGGVDLRKLAKGLMRSAGPNEAPTSLSSEIAEGLAGFGGTVRIILATADRTAQAFEASWDKDDPRIARCLGANHAYAQPEHQAWLTDQILACLRT